MAPVASAPVDLYLDNPMTSRDRRLGRAASAWVRSFSCEDVRPLVVCRGPIRKEALDTFRQMGITRYGMLLSDKDSIVYKQALAPELRSLGVHQVHPIRDYSGASKDERVQRMQEIVAIAREHGYTHVFAGYGFMAEDAEFVRTIEDAGLVFIGPGSSVQLAAGLKDEAKRTALEADVSVTPGIDDATRRTVLHEHPTRAALRALAAANGLSLPPEAMGDDVPLARIADRLLEAAYARRIDLYTIDALAETLRREIAAILVQNPGRRVRLKAIGGGGGKGQRILGAIDPHGDLARAAERRASEVPTLVREILSEVKAGGVGDNKNILVEMNIEETRHNEIQLIGNGRWCVALGGRDCSLQMHEQKLLEISLTQEGLAQAMRVAERAGHRARIDSLLQEEVSLARMEAEAERFGLAVGLDSVSTFECIVEGDRHYFMEVNTRIQVEHRVTELCYRLIFRNPDEPTDAFEVTSLVEAMVLVARHGPRLPRPERARREVHAVEARLNATNRALEPHAGGLILSWSENKEDEIRDDQGISVRNPDTGSFMHYRLAGAYDSNIALLLTYGATREELFERLIDLLRRTRIRGNDLHTNLAFHVGLAQWFAARDVWAKPTTRFVVPYLTAVGLLAQRASELDPQILLGELQRRHEKQVAAAGPDAALAVRKVFALRDTLVRRPIERLLEEPHLLSAFLSRNVGQMTWTADERVVWTKNPLEVLADLYWLIGKEHRAGAPAANVIWDHDHALLERGLTFYRSLKARLGIGDGPGAWGQMVKLLSEAAAPGGDAELAARWPAVRSAHAGHQAGLELLSALVQLGRDAGFYELKVLADGRVDIPARLLDKALQDQMKRVLAPPPAMRSNEIVAVSGGMFYAQEAPDRPPFVKPGSHFEAGDPLYVIEIMKMFNRVHATFAGTVDAVLVSGGEGAIVQKGQPLFRVTPDEPLVAEDPVAHAERRRTTSLAYLQRV
ncbi:MAG: biotin carboxylase [Deltaproteobacteria bacterium]|nr:biotin carboxylase [Deltaproteobacteria bacterium]